MKINKKVYKYLHFLRRRYYMKKYGSEALNLLYEISQQTGAPIWLEWGTLLGSFREHGYIAHDDDIDVAIYSSDYNHDFQRAIFDRGFSILREFHLIDKKNNRIPEITEITLCYKGLCIDVFFNAAHFGKRICYSYDGLNSRVNKWRVRRYECPEIKEFITIDFEGSKCLVPVNTKECLEYYYGEDFMIPNSNWKDRKELLLAPNEYYGEMIGSWH